MDKRTELNSVLKTAMKEKNQVAVSTVRLILASLKDRDIAARSKGQADGVSDQEILSMLQGMVKQRQESAKIYKEAGREDLETRENEEIAVIERFLPQQMSEDEMLVAIEGIIKETGATGIRDMGKVMAALKTQYAGQVDMGKAGGLVKSKLGA